MCCYLLLLSTYCRICWTIITECQLKRILLESESLEKYYFLPYTNTFLQVTMTFQYQIVQRLAHRTYLKSISFLLGKTTRFFLFYRWNYHRAEQDETNILYTHATTRIIALNLSIQLEIIPPTTLYHIVWSFSQDHSNRINFSSLRTYRIMQPTLIKTSLVKIHEDRNTRSIEQVLVTCSVHGTLIDRESIC